MLKVNWGMECESNLTLEELEIKERCLMCGFMLNLNCSSLFVLIYYVHICYVHLKFIFTETSISFSFDLKEIENSVMKMYVSFFDDGKRNKHISAPQELIKFEKEREYTLLIKIYFIRIKQLYFNHF